MVAALGALLAFTPGVAQAGTNPQGIDAVCGAHRADIVVPFLHRYHVTIGWQKQHHDHRCAGKMARQTNSPNAGGVAWFGFQWDNWNWKGVEDVGTDGGQTAVACATFALAFTTNAPAGILLTIVRAGAAVGCGKAAIGLLGTINDNARLIK